MELIVTLAMKFWQWSLLILFVIIGLIINLMDKRKANITFAYRELPHLQPVKIPTKGKGFWKGIVMWLLSTRNWVVTQDWKYRMNGNEYIIPAGFQFDGDQWMKCEKSTSQNYSCNSFYIWRGSRSHWRSD